ncbi:M12 family metallo-peptidase [Nocardioides sp.]|uniref:M12 family metallo-peptidase n=1 Tax=Nocardioides sp. TaxID=35761 RepID=UPI003783AB78
MDGFRPSGAHVRVNPEHYTAFRVDTAQVRSALAGAAKAGSQRTTSFAVPTPTGGLEHFAVQRTSLLSPKLAAANPDISTWAGRSTDHRGTTIAMDLTPMGFHASVRPAGGQGAWYVDPAYNVRGTTTHLSYYGGSLPDQAQQLAEKDMPVVKKLMKDRAMKARAGGGPVSQKVYRLALVTDPSYYEYFGASSSNVTSEKVTLMNRVNQIYNDDLAINIELTADVQFNTEAETTGPNGPCGANPCWVNDPDATDNGGYVQGQIAYCDVGTLERNQIVLGQLVGASNYDIGHIMLGVNGGGIAGLGVVGSIEKGMGCTGLPDPTGDFMAIDYVAHEMGHQFGGNHTFNGTQVNCSGGNRNAGTSVEPGSGSSVMAYAGICRYDDLQPHTDPYFSQRTQTEVNAYTGSPAGAPVEVQDVAFRGLDNGDTITVGFPGAAGTKQFVVGQTSGATAYTAANMATQLSALVGTQVTVAGWGYDPYGEIYDTGEYPAPLTEPNAGGFQVMFAGDADPYTNDSDREDEPALQVTAPGATYVHVGETAKGGEPGNTGFEVNPTDNHNPTVSAPKNKTIPTRTPFTLTGTGKDADGDPLIYLWEQNDDARGHNGTGLVDNKKVFGPLFRVFGIYADVTDEGTLEYESPGENLATAADRTRTFPDLAQILAGNTNAKSGTCPKVAPYDPDNYTPVPAKARDCYSEFLPTSAYKGTPGQGDHAMHFRLTARDGVAGGGGVGYDDVTLKVDPKTGPFLVSSFGKSGQSVKGGKKTTITWKVNGTQKLAKNVKIVLSTDNGQTWKTVLAKKTANDGKVVVKMPKKKTSSAWIMIEAVGNYFFDVNDKAFRIK